MGGRIRRTPRSRRQQRHRWQKEQQALVQSADDSDSDGQKEQTSPPTQLPLKMRFKGGGVINGNGGSSSGGGNTLPFAASVPVSPSPSALPASPSLASQKQTHLRKKCGGGGSRLKRKPHKLNSLQSRPDCTTSQHPTAPPSPAKHTATTSSSAGWFAAGCVEARKRIQIISDLGSMGFDQTASVKAAEKTGWISTQICAELLLAGTLSNARSRRR